LNEDAPLPQVNAREVIRALEHEGFSIVRTSGGHVQMKKPGHRYVVTVPQHGAKSIKPGTLRQIIRGAGITKAEFVDALRCTK